MGSETRYPKRLIEVDLPIKEISAHARREKSIRHGHISTLHIWWARRPLAACRAVICATLWPDPADDSCPQSFRESIAEILADFAEAARIQRELQELAQSHWGRWNRLGRSTWKPSDPVCWWDMRYALLDFIADFADWDASTQPVFLTTARRLTQAAHEALGGTPGTRPIVVDPFAGGGSIPLESLRVGADTFAIDLNPVAVLLNKVVLEYIPKYGHRLTDEVRKWGEWIQHEAKKELAEFYPGDPSGATPIVYLWSRTIQCEGPGCGAEIPLVRSFLLGKHEGNATGIRVEISSSKRVITYKLEQAKSPDPFKNGTLRRGSATCLICGYTTPGARVRKQMAEKQGGADSARLLAVYCESSRGRFYREPTPHDLEACARAHSFIEGQRKIVLENKVSAIPDEELPYLRSIFNVNLIGINRWELMFSSRQLASLLTLAKLARSCFANFRPQDTSFAVAVATVIALAIDRQADYLSSICTWVQAGEFVGHTFAQGQSLPIKWDFAETVPFASGSGNWTGAVGWVTRVLDEIAAAHLLIGNAHIGSATEQLLPDDLAQCILTDPPYYDAVPYADLSDFFYVWLKRTIGPLHPELFQERTTRKEGEIVQLAERNPQYSFKTKEYFEQLMRDALRESRRVAAPSGLAVIVFAHKDTQAWEAMLQAVVAADWIVVASWPIDTERAGRLRAMGSAALASSVHLVCRPRETPDGAVLSNDIGDWRDVLLELPLRIHEWMPRLSQEGVVGADAIFACLGPALEIFSRYSRVEKISGETVTLKEYLEEVWAAVAREALSMIFADADTTRLEEDARLTAMWLWTLSTERGGNDSASSKESEQIEDNEEDTGGSAKSFAGFTLEYDAARKIAQGLGAHLEALQSLVEISGETARLLLVAERTRYLFGREAVEPAGRRRAKKHPQMGLFQELEAAEEVAEWRDTGAPTVGETVLDRIHQAMILFAAGRAEALKRFLVEEGVGRDSRFWKLAQSLSALYPNGTDEKRWVDGVLARKKGLGFG